MDTMPPLPCFAAAQTVLEAISTAVAFVLH